MQLFKLTLRTAHHTVHDFFSHLQLAIFSFHCRCTLPRLTPLLVWVCPRTPSTVTAWATSNECWVERLQRRSRLAACPEAPPASPWPWKVRERGMLNVNPAKRRAALHSLNAGLTLAMDVLITGRLCKQSRSSWSAPMSEQHTDPAWC